CANLDPVPAYPLNSVTNNASDTVANVSLAELAKGGYAINVHKSAAEVSVYVACGNIEPMDLTPSQGPGVGLGGAPGMPSTGGTEQVPEQVALLLGLGALAAACIGAGMRLSRRRI